MSMTETRPDAAGEPAPGSPPVEPVPPILDWVTSVDHRRIGLAYIYTALAFAAVAAVAALGTRIELWGSGFQLLDADNGQQLYTLFLSALFFLFLIPAFIGLAVYLVPLQIGARRLAFPRMNAFAYWLYLGGGVIAAASYLVDGGPYSARLLIVQPGSIVAGRSSALWVYGMGAVAVATVIAAVGLLATLVNLRAPGMGFDRLPPFSWSALVSSVVVVLTVPVFLSGLVLEYLNVRHGGSSFAHGRTSTVIWQHVLWLYGRPELYLLLIMGAGVVSEVVSTFARRPLLDRRAALALLGAMGAAALLVWAHDKPAADAPLGPTYAWPVALAFVPLAGLVLMWLGTLAQGRPRPSAALVHAVGFVLVLGAAMVGAISAVVPVRAGTAWAEGHLQLLFWAPSVMALSAAVFYWAPKLWGRHLSEALGYLQFLLLLGGSLVGLAPFYLGLRDQPRYALDVPHKFLVWNRVATAGAVLVSLALVVFFLNLAGSVWARRGRLVSADPGEAQSPEWLPPPDEAVDHDANEERERV